jgi:hypothetical protein
MVEAARRRRNWKLQSMAFFISGVVIVVVVVVAVVVVVSLPAGESEEMPASVR